jgi:isopropylmalate/homocitrate/citramalate synthase
MGPRFAGGARFYAANWSRHEQPNRLIIFDTTLRDGEQSPGASMTKDEKVRIARQLERMRVDVIEAGFAAASPGDFEAIRAIASVIKESTVCSLSRANDRDIARAAEALAPAARKRIHTFIATSPLHMKMKLRMEPEQVLNRPRWPSAARASTPTTSNFRPKTAAARKRISCAACWKR